VASGPPTRGLAKSPVTTPPHMPPIPAAGIDSFSLRQSG
jgi:hypothetical protein